MSERRIITIPLPEVVEQDGTILPAIELSFQRPSWVVSEALHQRILGIPDMYPQDPSTDERLPES